MHSDSTLRRDQIVIKTTANLKAAAAAAQVPEIAAHEDEFPLEQDGAEDVEDDRLVELLKEDAQVHVLETAVQQPLDLDRRRIVRRRWRLQLDAAAGPREALAVQVVQHGRPLDVGHPVPRHHRVQQLEKRN